MRKTSRFILFILSIIMAGCLNINQAPLKIHYYFLSYPSPVQPFEKKIPGTIRIVKFNSSPIFRTDRIVYSRGGFERDSYTYHRWRAMPGEIVSYFLKRDIQNSGIFKGVVEENSVMESRYRIEGRIDQFIEEDLDEGWKAKISIVASLVNISPNGNESLVFEKHYKETADCPQKNPVGLAKGMSQGMSGISKRIIGDIYKTLNE